MFLLNLLLFQAVFTFGVLQAGKNLQCMDDSGNSVDWLYGYKLPILKNEQGYLRSGFGYVFITPSGKTWTLSTQSLNDETSFLGETLRPLFDENQARKILYLAYNDDPPKMHASLSYAHAKGVVATDGTRGFWLIHSSPRFPEIPNLHPASEEDSEEVECEKGYTFPTSASKFGQSFLCISLPHTEFEAVGLQLQYMRPKVYVSNAPDSLAKKFPALKAVIDGQYVKSGPFNHAASLKSLGGVEFLSFAKGAKFGRDLYSKYVAGKLGAPLKVETWSNGPGPLTSCYSGEYPVVNIKELDITANKHKLEFWNAKDHSKWAVTAESSKNYICVGDINRMMSQYKRGGGTVCQKNEVVWKAYSDAIEMMDGYLINKTCDHSSPGVTVRPKKDSDNNPSENEIPNANGSSKSKKKRGKKGKSNKSGPEENSTTESSNANEITGNDAHTHRKGKKSKGKKKATEDISNAISTGNEVTPTKGKSSSKRSAKRKSKKNDVEQTENSTSEKGEPETESTKSKHSSKSKSPKGSSRKKGGKETESSEGNAIKCPKSKSKSKKKHK